MDGRLSPKETACEDRPRYFSALLAFAVSRRRSADVQGEQCRGSDQETGRTKVIEIRDGFGFESLNSPSWGTP